jgi:ribose 5-phosphate isomerase A
MVNDLSQFKKQAAEKAVEDIESGMIIGLGTGSTVSFALKKISNLIKEGKLKDITGIPSSKRTQDESIELGIPLTDFNKVQKIDLTIDGADEVDSKLNLIKGGGGALLREKVLAQASRKLIIIVDESKISTFLGEKWPVPIEVIQFAAPLEEKFLKSIGGITKIRITAKEENYLTDEGNFILDTNFGKINNPIALSEKLEKRAGIVEHGLFIGMTDKVITAGKSGLIIFDR